jgi:hypothetical protein
LSWDDLIVEPGTAPPPIDDIRFRDWMSRQRIFVSSVMDEEMQPAREQLRSWIRRWGGTPEMWEELAPRDQHPKHAYLDGVDRGTVYVLLAGTSYGVQDESGFSPTHQEGERAKQRAIPRLLLEKADSSERRDGYLRRWIASLYNEVSAGKYHTTEDLLVVIEARLREMASAQATPWVKLGQLVFPGRVVRRGGAQTEIIVAGTVRGGALRRAISNLGHFGGRVRADRLTWGVESHPVRVVNAESETAFTTEDQVTITCAFPNQYFGPDSGIMPVSYGINGGPDSQVAVWARHMLFGEPIERENNRYDLVTIMSVPSGISNLPTVLRQYQLQGWAAEGLTRLYVVEELISRHGGHFDVLEVGPATAAGVRVEARYCLAGHEQLTTQLSGVVPLR